MGKKSNKVTNQIIEETPIVAIEPEVSTPTPLYKVKVTQPPLRKRSEPSLNGKEVDIIHEQAVYEIYVEQDGWGQLEDKTWIMLRFTQKVKI